MQESTSIRKILAIQIPFFKGMTDEKSFYEEKFPTKKPSRDFEKVFLNFKKVKAYCTATFFVTFSVPFERTTA